MDAVSASPFRNVLREVGPLSRRSSIGRLTAVACFLFLFIFPAQQASAAGPTSIGVDSDGVIYVGFESGGEIKRYAGADGAELGSWGTAGNAPGQLGGIVAIDVAPGNNGNVWVLDTNRRVQEFTRSGTYLRGFQVGACSNGVSPDPLQRGGLDVTNDDIFVANPCSTVVARYRKSDFGLQNQGSPSAVPKGVSSQLYGSAPSQTQRTYVAYPAIDKVAKIQPWFSTDNSGGFDDPYGFKSIPGSPTDVFIDAFGVLFVSETSTDRIYLYDQNGNEFRWVGGSGTDVGRFDQPQALDVFEQYSDLSGNLFVADYANERIQRLNPFGFTFWAVSATDEPGGGAQGPVNSTAPTISGTPTVGNTLTCQSGTWTNSPTSYSYGWFRNGSPIGGANNQSYTLVGADNGAEVYCVETATNSAGSASAQSASVFPSAPQAPVNNAPPTISGTASPGETLTCNDGSWNGANGFTYAWQRDGSQVATGKTFNVTNADLGSSLTCSVTATNSGGSTTAFSDPVTVTAAPGNGPVGVTINDRAVFTNSPGVTLTIREPGGADTVKISNDGSFQDAVSLPIAGDDTYPWTLQTSGSERLPKTVYVRFEGDNTIDPKQTYTDDIVLDETAPAAFRATFSAKKNLLKVKASDRGGSGVKTLELSRSKSGKKVKSLGFKKKLRGKKAKRAKFVRVADKAGNVSAWKKVKKKGKGKKKKGGKGKKRR